MILPELGNAHGRFPTCILLGFAAQLGQAPAQAQAPQAQAQGQGQGQKACVYIMGLANSLRSCHQGSLLARAWARVADEVVPSVATLALFCTVLMWLSQTHEPCSQLLQLRVASLMHKHGLHLVMVSSFIDGCQPAECSSVLPGLLGGLRLLVLT